jgi:hypothetical protein
MRIVVIGVFLVSIALALLWDGPNPTRAPGVLVPWEPDQEPVAQLLKWDYHGEKIEALARFRVRGRVLFATRYWWGREADLSPMDLTLGWRPMSDQSVLDTLELYHSHRSFSFALTRRSPRSAGKRSTRMLPTCTWSRLQTRCGAIGQVRARGPGGPARVSDRGGGQDGWKWRSSLSRADIRRRGLRTGVGGGREQDVR